MQAVSAIIPTHLQNRPLDCVMQAVAAGTAGTLRPTRRRSQCIKALLSLVESSQNVRLSVLTVGINPRLRNTGTQPTTRRRALSCSLAPGMYLQKFLGGEFLTCAGPLGSAASRLSVPKRAYVCPPVRLYNGFAEMTFRIPPTGFSTSPTRRGIRWTWQCSTACPAALPLLTPALKPLTLGSVCSMFLTQDRRIKIKDLTGTGTCDTLSLSL